MEFLALPEEQAESVCQLHAELSVRIILQRMFTQPPEDEYIEIRVGKQELNGFLRSQTISPSGGSRYRLYLREAALPGDFVYDPDIGLQLNKSLAVELWPSAIDGKRMFIGSTGIAGREWYEYEELDHKIPRRLKTKLERILKKMCKLRAAPNYMVAELVKGKRPRGLTALTVYVSEGAHRFKQEGGRWYNSLQPNIEYKLLPNKD